MVRTTSQDTVLPHGRGPERFQQPVQAARRPPLAVAGALVALVALVVGVPAGLVALGAPPPVPTSLPTRTDLAGTLGAEQLLTVLVAVVWLAWLQFCVCVGVEVVSAVRDAGLPRPVPLAGPSQRLARVLVGTLLLTGVVAGQASAAAPAVDLGTRTGVVAAQEAAATDASAAAVAPADPDEQAAPRAGEAAAAAPALPPALADLVGRRVYTVVPPEGRYHDNLWDIAERELGDGRRYGEIYALNEGRLQPDGSELELARLIQPGWQLVMPEDATGVERLVAPAPAPAPAAPAPAGPPAPGGVDVGVDGGVGGVEEGTGGAVSPDAGTVETAPQGALGLGALAAAGLGAVLLRRRRSSPGADPGAEAVEAEARLRVGADPVREALLLRALTSLRTGTPTGAYAVLVDDGEVEVRLAPPRPDAPAPWAAEEAGARWVVAATDLDDPATPGGAAAPPGPAVPGPFSALVGLGRDVGGRDVLVDLAAAAGPVEVTGPGAHEVVAALAAELVTCPWGEGLDVALWHLPAELSALGPRAEAVEDARDLLAPTPTPDVLTGRAAPSAAPRRALVLGATPPAAVAERLAAGGAASAVLVAGTAPGARWALRVDDAGTLAVDALDLVVTANRLSEPALARVSELFRALAPVGGGDAAPGDDRPPVPPGPVVDDAAWAAARVRVGVLGALLVEAPGAVDPSRRELVEEVVAHVALHPAGVHPTVLGGDVWPQGAGTAVRTAVVDRARDVLGSDPGGSYRLGEDADGRLVLGAGAVVDRDVLLHLLRRSRSAPPEAERELLRRALALVRGPLLEGHPPRRYGWLPRTGAERTTAALVVDAALRLGALETRGGDPGGAASAAAAGLRAVPASQLLWRLLLTSRAAAGAGTQEAGRAMRAAVAAAGEVPDGETVALLAELAPQDRAG